MQKLLYCIILLLSLSCKEKKPQHKNALEEHSNTFYKKAFLFLDNNEQDSAFLYLNKAKDVFIRHNDNFGVGKSLMNMALIQENYGDNYGSIETSLLATKFLDEKDHTQYSIIFCNYNNLGITSNNLKSYNDAKRFYNKAQHFIADPIDKMMLQNNVAILYHQQKKYQDAIAIYKKLIDSVGVRSKYYPRLLLNYSRSRWYLDPSYNPINNYLLAEKLSQKYDDDWTKDAAYSYLSTYYLKKNKDSARLYSEKMLALSKNLNYPEDQLEALQNLIRLSNTETSKSYFDNYIRINDSLVTAKNRARNQFALIRFESEKAKADNLKLQKEKDLNAYQVTLQRIIIWIIVVTTAIICIIAFILIKKRRQKILMEAREKLQKQRLDFSKKVHDVVANGIYEVMVSLETQTDMPKEKLLDKLELMYEKSRDLSYNQQDNEPFNEKITGLIHTFDTTETQIIIIGNDFDFWEGFCNEVKDNLLQVIRELLVNMKKHSHAKQVILKFSRSGKAYEISYRDNGVGLPKDFEGNNGFTNMKSRLQSFGAVMIFPSVEQGTLINIEWNTKPDKANN